MRVPLFVGCILCFASFTSNPSTLQIPPKSTPQRSTNADRPLPALPYSPSLNVSSMDKSVDPCIDFYTYACGGWMKNNRIPADEEAWSVYAKLYVDNQRYLWGILDQLASHSAGRSPNQQKIGDYFGACMDEAGVEKRGLKPLQVRLDRIAAMKSKNELPTILAEEHLVAAQQFFSGGSGWPLFRFVSLQDFGNSQNFIAFAMAGGLRLPDRDYFPRSFVTNTSTISSA